MSSDADEDVLFKEIQASIAEGRMMLPVLRSLPPSENNTALIYLFEELITRLQNYRPQDKRSLSQSEVQQQLNILKEKQERIRSLLTQAAQGLQTASLSQPFASSSQPISDEITDSPAELISKFKAWLAGDAQSTTNLPNNGHCVEDAIQEAQGEIALEKTPENVLPPESTKPSMEESVAALNWNVQFAAQVTKLNDLIEDTRRFEGMASRLLDITKRARLREPSDFLQEIIMRFGELRKSFNSLRESYEALGNDPQMTEKLRELQLATFQEFCVKLDRNLECTKECFFTIYHLVKSNIDQGMVDGSLYGTESDEESPAQGVAQTVPQAQTTPDSAPVAAIPNPPIPAKRVAQVDSSAPTSNPALVAQQAYLAELQDQTRVEQEEIRRLLHQRDVLAERLRTLKQAALVSNQVASLQLTDVPISNQQTAETHNETEANQSADTDMETSSDSPAGQRVVQDRLNSKRRELEELKSQLALLRKAEQNLSPALRSTDPSEPSSNQVITLQGPTALREFLEGSKSSSSAKPEESTRKNRYNISLDGDTVRFQQPEATHINGDADQSYENARDTAIRFQTQSGSSLVNGVEMGKLLNHAIGAAASVAASQDRTTLATWGGSSPMAPSSAASSSSESGHSVDELDSDRAGDFLTKSADSTQPTRHNRHPSESGPSKDTLAPPDRIAMPQLGHSPSPPRRFESKPQDNVSPRGTDSASVEDRLQRLENAVSQLLQICRYLTLENSRLSIALTQLMMPSGRVIQQFTAAPVASSPVPFSVPAPVQHSHQHPQPQQQLISPFQPGLSAAVPFNSSQSPASFPTARFTQPFGLSQKSSAAGESSQEQLHALLAQLTQQQLNYFHLQNEFQRLIRQQLESGAPFMMNTAAPWRLSTPLPSQPMSPNLSRAASVPHPAFASVVPSLNEPALSTLGLAPWTSQSGWPGLNPWTFPPHGSAMSNTGAAVGMAPFTAQPINSITGFPVSFDPSGTNFMSSRSSVHEPSNAQSTHCPVTDLLNQIWNPPSSATAKPGFM